MDTEQKSEVIVQKKHALAIRWTHWVNFPILLLMIVSGLMIYWANDIYTPFIPESAFKSLHLDHRLALGLSMHFFFMWFFTINGFIYILYLLYSGEWREIVPRLSTLRDALWVTLHDFGFRKGLPPQGKFNGAQKMAYSGVLLLGFVQVLTGLAIYKPVQLQSLLLFFGGYDSARGIHFIVTVLFVLFFAVHVAQVLRSGWNHFRAMITGIEEVKK